MVVDGYREKADSAAIVYGTAVHKYIDTMFQTKGDIKKAREAAFAIFRKEKFIGKGQDHLGDERHLMVTCYNYWEDVILKDQSIDVLQFPNGNPATEVTFSLPYMETDDYEVRLCGTIDTIAKVKNGCFLLRDFKTTSKWDVKEYLASYKMSKQLRFYALALRLMHERFPDSLLGKIGGTNVGARIDGIFLKPSPGDNVYRNSDVFIFQQDTIAEFRTVLDRMITDFLAKLKSGVILREGIVNNTCKTDYPCKFINICGAPQAMVQTLLDRDFRRVDYNPLAFHTV